MSSCLSIFDNGIQAANWDVDISWLQGLDCAHLVCYLAHPCARFSAISQMRFNISYPD
jgi:hypothetical protein